MINIEIKNSEKVKSVKSKKSLFITFSYNSKIIDIIRGFSNRFWHTDSKAWELPVDILDKFIDKLQDQEIKITGDYISFIEEQSTKEIPKEFKFKTKPFEHQLDSFNFGLSCDSWLLGDEQGLGKTKQVIDIAVAKKYQKGYKHCLIICGVNGLKWNWQNEVKIHSNETAWILGQRTKGHKTTIGSTKDKINDLESILTTPGAISSYFLITNVESLRNEEIVSKISSLTKSGVIGVVAIDEVHKCKNPSSQQGKGILKVDAECKIAMTGTPIMNNPMDLYIILRWLGYEGHSFFAFKKHYCVMGGYGGYEVVGYKHLDELQDKLSLIMLRRRKEEVLDLPDKLYIDEFVDMTAKQAQVYKEVTAEIKSNIDQIAIAPNPLAQLIRMRQATGYTGILSSTIAESAKLDRMEEIIDEAVDNGKKVVIFSNWTQMTDIVWSRLSKKYKGTIITGETADAERQINVNTFQTNDECKFIVGTIGAMGTGLTLTSGTVEIFLDEPWNKALKDQAEDRCHRIGAKENVTIYTLLCKNTIDERIHDLVIKKGAMSDAIVDGKLNSNKAEMLNYLLS